MTWKGSSLRVYAAVTVLAAASVAAEAAAPRFRMYVEHSGVYKVSYEELLEAGLEDRPWPSESIGARNLGQPVPVWIEDGDDGVFGAGDWIELVGERLRGDYSYLDEYSRYNCYVLGLDDPDPERFRIHLVAGRYPPQFQDFAALRTGFHVERDLLRLRFSVKKDEPEEVWYWAKLTPLDREPFRQVLDLGDLDRDSGAIVRLRVGVRGWSKPRRKRDQSVADHHIVLRVDGVTHLIEEWDGKDHRVLELELPVAAFSARSTIALRVPARKWPATDQPVVDVVVLNWIEIDYPRVGEIDGRQASVTVARELVPRPVPLSSVTGQPLSVYSAGGLRIVPKLPEAVRKGRHAFLPPEGETRFSVSAPAGMMAVDELVRDQPSDLRATDRQVDYIMIAHRSLMEAVEPLAEFHRGRGMNVTVVDVQDVFDDFNHGIVHPRSIRDFLSHAYHHWQRPAPRFVLLVGDASWDFKNPTADDTHYADWTYRPGEQKRFVKNTSTPYAEGANHNDRNLVPTWNYPTHQGNAASDTWFACVDGDDEKPDMAIGRFPVVEPDEVRSIVAKSIAYAQNPEVGPWRRQVLYIANESSAYQRRSDQSALHMVERGWVTHKIYPAADQAVSEQHTRSIVDLLDQGLQIVHFIGHGGRYIWRTGPPDLTLNRDLFTLDHLDDLVPTRRLPVILSLTCYSAPFDHPTADSIGEKFLRLEDRGAIAVVAASWRNSPSPQMGEALMSELSQPGATIGEAVQRAKNVINNPVLIQMYNLLGDPAAPVAAPGRTIKLKTSRRDGAWRVQGRSKIKRFSGQAVVEWLDADLQIVHREELQLARSKFVVELPDAAVSDGEVVAGVRAYMWDADTGQDAVGWVGFAALEPNDAESGTSPSAQVERSQKRRGSS